jgi:hypothetical protein
MPQHGIGILAGKLALPIPGMGVTMLNYLVGLAPDILHEAFIRIHRSVTRLATLPGWDMGFILEAQLHKLIGRPTIPIQSGIR